MQFHAVPLDAGTYSSFIQSLQCIHCGAVIALQYVACLVYILYIIHRAMDGSSCMPT